MEYQRQVKINISLTKAYLFIREVENLPVWTRFFKRCISCSNAIGEMETVLGKSLTSIQEERTDSSVRLLICSKFDQGQEQAMVTIEGDSKQANVAFYLKIPSEVSKERQKQMVSNLEAELHSLKQYLESGHA
jgi:hypothetical protein